MSEQLAVKTDDDWTKGKIEKVIRTLTPRESDGGMKSTWAHHSLDDAIPDHQVLTDPDRAPRVLQALLLFFNSELRKRADGVSRSSVKGVSILRSAVTECDVLGDSQRHLIPAYEPLHRSLVLTEPDQIERTAREIIAKQAADSWRYSRVDMANVLRYLLDSKCVARDMEADAWSVLAQWEAAS